VSRRAKQVRVLVAEDDPGVRQALAALIDAEPTFRLVGVAADATEAVELASLHATDVALIDVRMPGGGGPAAVQGIARVSPATKVIALSAQSDRGTVIEMLQAGVVGYLLKGGSVEEIAESIKRAAAGEGTLSVELTTNVIEELVGLLDEQKRVETRRDLLRRRMTEVLVDESSFSMVFQPIVSLDDDAVVGAEALARFAHRPLRGPQLWFAEAEGVGLREKLELAAARKAIAALPELPPDIYLAVNVSPSTVSSSRFRALVSPAEGVRLVIEITEYAAVEDYGHLGARIAELRELGVRVAIDDTGAGFASLTHLLRLDPDVIKLDRSFVEAIDSDQSAQALASGIVAFGARSGAEVVAEGIEKGEQLAALVELGVQHGQGFHLAMPGPLPLAPRGDRGENGAAPGRQGASCARRRAPRDPAE
jgi:EAL domain-containing protein (putative c-di-GMP-specific phosphodiesterase class I)/CheY-like chemotaxis protein